MEFEHPRHRQQKEDRQTLLAGIQYELGLSREELKDHFSKIAFAKTQELLDNQNSQKPACIQFPNINGADYALNHYKPIKNW